MREKTDFRDEVYWIQYKNQDRYLFPVVNDPIIGPYMRVVTKNDSSALKWRIQKSGKYYTIKSVQHNMYLGVPTSSSVLSNVPTLYEEVSIYTKWRIFAADNGYIFVPAVMMNGKVMSPGSNQPENAGYVGFFDYFDTTFFKYWNLECTSTYMVNYYDYSVQYDLPLKNSITVANSFVNQLFDTCFSHNLYMDGVATYYGDLTCNSCFCGVDVPCSNSSDCSSHHKNQDVFFDEVKRIPYNRGDVFVMWANHIGNVFCREDKNGNHTITSLALAFCYESRIIFNYFRENVEWNPNVPASLIFAHEVGHKFGLPEQYDLDPVGHSNNGSMVCVMQRYGRDRAETFFDYLKGADSDFSNVSDAFCDDCMAILTESVEAS